VLTDRRSAARIAQPETVSTRAPLSRPLNDIDARQQRAAERWASRQYNAQPGEGAAPSTTHSPTQTPERELDRTPELRRDGPEDDLEL
jgi:hypothetical protein